MKSLRSTAIICSCLLCNFFSSAQSLTQTIKGIVQDADSEYPLIGATITVLDSEPQIATTTNLDGSFRLESVPVGRQSLEVRYLGYQTGYLANLVVTSGKELAITVQLQESTQDLQEVVVRASADKQNPLNEMASVSARSFSVEETGRYAAALLDPARMAQNFAGVMSSGDDLLNEIVIRGNSPAYVQWRLEGLQIPSPNHFTSKGSSGGGISMLSSSILTNSDFYTGAFPSEIGNVLAGAFDLKLRNGNNEKREYSFMLGALGTEVSMEGPFTKGAKASYLVNYRYSTLALLDRIGLSPVDVGDAGLDFQDLSFKFNFPTQNAGVFSIFGLGGLTREGSKAEPDSSKWSDFDDLFAHRSDGNLGILGLTHKYLFPNQKSYLHMILGYTYDQYRYNDEFLDVRNDNRVVEDEVEDLVDESLRFSLTFNHKFNARHTLRLGGVYGLLNYKFENTERMLNFLDGYQLEYSEPAVNLSSSGSTELMQAFGQWKYRFDERWTFNAGLHFMYLTLNDSYSVEPRGSLKFQFSPKQSLTLAAGVHSQMEHLINYLVIRDRQDGSVFQPNKGLELTKAVHYVLGYDHSFSGDFRLKLEAYYQQLYDVPNDSTFRRGSILNTTDVYDVLYGDAIFSNSGKGRNLGLDLTLEKFYSRGYYALLTGSVFDSRFENAQGETFNTRFNARYNLTILGGKEYKAGKSRQNIFSLNGKILYSGGNRYDEVDWDRSIAENRFITTADGFYKLQVRPYFRIDASARYSINRPRATHSIVLEFQNIMNRENVADIRYDFNTRSLRETFQTGLIPNFNYRIEF